MGTEDGIVRENSQPKIGLTGSANLMAHPMGAIAAASAMGAAVAGQAFGTWLGMVAGAMEASARLLSAGAPAGSGSAPGATAAGRARKAADTLIAEAHATAQAVAEAPAAPAAASRPSEAAATKTGTRPSKPAPAVVPVTLMPEDFRRPRSLGRPERPDDLKAIAGIGPKLEKVLNGLGIWTYGQVAGWDAEEIAWVDDYLAFSGRIERDGWVAQAKSLAEGRSDG